MFRPLLLVTISALLLNGCGVNKNPAPNDKTGVNREGAPATPVAKPKSPLILPPSGLEGELDTYRAKAQKTFEFGPSTFPARPANNELISSPNVPDANQFDFLLVDDKGKPVHIDWRGRHVIHGFQKLVDNKTFEDTDVQLFDGAEHKPKLDPKLFFTGKLQDHAVALLKAQKKLRLPLIEASEMSLYRAQAACVAKANGPCIRSLNRFLENVLEGSDKAIPFFPTLVYNAEAMTLAAGEEIRVDLAQINFFGKNQTLKNEACASIPTETALSKALPDSFFHPGKSPHVNELLNRALESFRTKKIGRPETHIADFVGRMQIADCKLTAASEIQVHRDQCGIKAAHLLLVARGSVISAKPGYHAVDITTANHVWNAFGLTKPDGSISLGLFVMWDRTPSESHAINYVFNDELTKTVLAKLDAAAEAEFSLGHAMARTEPKEIGISDKWEDTKNEVTKVALDIVAKFKAKVVTKGDEAPVVDILYNLHPSVGRKGELIGAGDAGPLFSQSFGVFHDGKIRSLGAKKGDRQFEGVVTSMEQIRGGYLYPDNYSKGEDVVATARKMAAYFNLDWAQVEAEMKRLHANESNWAPKFTGNGDINAGNALGQSIFPSDRVTAHHIARYWRDERGVKGIRPKFTVKLGIFVHPK